MRRTVAPALPVPQGQAVQWVAALRQRLHDAGGAPGRGGRRHRAGSGSTPGTSSCSTPRSRRYANDRRHDRPAVRERRRRAPRRPGAQRRRPPARNGSPPTPLPDLSRVPAKLEPTVARAEGHAGRRRPDRPGHWSTELHDGLRAHVYARSAELVAELVRQFTVDVLKPLGTALSDAQVVLERASTAGRGRPRAGPARHGPADRLAARRRSAGARPVRRGGQRDPADQLGRLPRPVRLRHPRAGRRAPVPSRTPRPRSSRRSSPATGRPRAASSLPAALLEPTVDEWRPGSSRSTRSTPAEQIIPDGALRRARCGPRSCSAGPGCSSPGRGESFDKFCRVSIRDFVTGVDVEPEADDQRR